MVAKTKKIQNVTPCNLTTAGEKLLFTLSNPQNYLKNVTQICKIAKISRGQYYRLYRDEKFREQAVALARQIFASSTPAIAHKVAKEALKGSLAHQEIILVNTGVIKPQGTPVIAQQFNVGSKMELEFIEGSEK